MISFLILSMKSRKVVFSKHREEMVSISIPLSFFPSFLCQTVKYMKNKKTRASLLEPNESALSPVCWHPFTSLLPILGA